jgi:hypothetical protein
VAELDDDSAAAEAEESIVWWPFNPGDPDGEDEPGDLVVKAESRVVDDGAELPDKDPVGLPLDCVPKMVFVDPAVALVELGRAAEDDRELSPPVEDDVVAEDVTEEASFAATNPVIGLVDRSGTEVKGCSYQHGSDQHRRWRKHSSRKYHLTARRREQQAFRKYCWCNDH